MEELDRMDWARFQRAMQAAEIERVELERRRFLEHGGQVDAEDWVAIVRHDAGEAGKA